MDRNSTSVELAPAGKRLSSGNATPLDPKLMRTGQLQESTPTAIALSRDKILRLDYGNLSYPS